MSGVNCDVSDENLQYCKEFLKKCPEATNWDKICVERLMVSFLINKNPNHTSLNENYVVPCICLRAI